MGKFNVAHITDTGKTHTNNEDALVADEQKGIFIVADGLGGHNAGEIASQIAVNTLPDLIYRNIKNEKKPKEIKPLICAAIVEVHKDILRQAKDNKNKADMGTTVVIAAFHNERLFIANVGDSRAYIVRDGTIAQVSKDDTYVADLVKTRRIRPEEAINHPQKNQVTQALGGKQKISPHVTEIGFSNDDTLLLCSDGLTEHVSDNKILTKINDNKNLKEAASALINLANDRGGTDNITLILIRRDNESSC